MKWFKTLFSQNISETIEKAEAEANPYSIARMKHECMSELVPVAHTYGYEITYESSKKMLLTSNSCSLKILCEFSDDLRDIHTDGFYVSVVNTLGIAIQNGTRTYWSLQDRKGIEGWMTSLPFTCD